ncbi:hypothetical protein ACMGDK_11645 [Chryseobacterium sp. DT-3]|uniref:hypothetical protein n=1 Tax=Chryseobacterium sp. DT-3 TaxID=3396164 RepID=UPI003F1DD533
MENTLENKENELLELLNKYVLPDINKYPQSSYQYCMDYNMFDRVSFLFCFVKYENEKKERKWSLLRIYKDKDDTSESYEKMVERQIRILKSIHENPNIK